SRRGACGTATCANGGPRLDRARAAPIEGHRLDERVDLKPRRETQLPRRPRSDPGSQGGRSDSDRDLDDTVALQADFADFSAEHVLDADSLRTLQRDRNVAGADTHSHLLPYEGVDA